MWRKPPISSGFIWLRPTRPLFWVDEKPSIGALERAQGYLKLPNGRALTGHAHDYRRHGTTTLFAALEVATGGIIARQARRRGSSSSTS